MKTKLTLLFFAVFFMNFSLHGAAIGGISEPPTGDPFTLNEEAINKSMAGLTALEQYLLENEGTTLADLEAINHPLVQDLNLTTSNTMSPAGVSDNGPAGIPSFLWGFCLGAIGLLIVWLVTEDGDELKKSLWGFLTAIAIYVVIYVIAISNVY